MSRFAPTLAGSAEDSERLLIRVVSEEAELVGMSDEWEQLCRESPDSEFFVSWLWLQTWWNEYRGTSTLRIYTVRSARGELLGVLPTYLKQKRSMFNLKYYELRFIGTGAGPAAGYFDLIARPKDRGRVSKAIIPMLLGASAVWDYLCLESMPAESPLTRRLMKDLVGYGLDGERTQCPIVELPPDWSMFLQMLSDDERKNVNHVRERFSFDQSLEFDVAESTNLVRLSVDRLIGLAKQSRAGLEQAEQDLLRRVARKSATNGLARGLTIKRNGEVVAALTGFVWQNTFYCTHTATSKQGVNEEYDLLIATFAIELAIGIGCQRCDFLGGANDAIRALAPQTRETASVTAFRSDDAAKRVRWVKRLGGK